MRIGVAIPTYRNSNDLKRCLLSVQQVSAALAECIVVTDDSGNGCVAAELRFAFPQVQWIVHESNVGFGVSANDAINACAADVVVLLNDDVQLTRDPTAQIENAFHDTSLFAATFQSFHADGTFREGAKRLVWPMGIPRILHNPHDQNSSQGSISPSAYAVGGHAAYRREYFCELNGFDPLFAPFYWEDVDLCERARKRGHGTIYLPQCTVIHDGQSAIRTRHDAAFLRSITMRNRLLFAWRHLPPYLAWPHKLSLVYHLILGRISGNTEFANACRAARARQQEYS